MNTRAITSAAGVILAALQQNRTATGIALSLESAGLLMSPEAAADLASVSTDAVGVTEQAVKELQREHELSAGVRQENVRLFLAWGSARMRARRKNEALKKLRARVAELEAQRQADQKTWRHDLRTARDEREAMAARIAELELERHSTNDALADVTLAQRAAESADRLTAFFAPVASLREEPAAEAVTPRVPAMRALLDGQRAAVEDPHDGPLHHSYRVPRDLPQLGGAQ
ncbi:hypothetical protein ACFC01_17850 [Streptomyces mirabilis]|uniref:hypothetical protein n=1 Tax=Streptomyces mirabilis TaxID=68239 RepID=UPI0035E00862